MKRSGPLLMVLTLTLPATAAVIDTFTSGDQAISWPAAQGTAAVTSEVPIAGSLFDTRYLRFYFGGSQSLTVTSNEQALAYDLGTGVGYFEFGYRSASPVDLFAGGASILRFHFEGASGGTRFPANLAIATASGTALYSWGFALTDLFNDHEGAFVVDVPLSQIKGGDLTRVTELAFDAFRISGDAGFRLSRIETIPEPTPLALLLLGGLPFLFARSRLPAGVSLRWM